MIGHSVIITGLGIWLQGISFGKITSNSNLATQRVQLNVVPVEQLNVTADYSGPDCRPAMPARS